jgi:hypothetical protein
VLSIGASFRTPKQFKSHNFKNSHCRSIIAIYYRTHSWWLLSLYQAGAACAQRKSGAKKKINRSINIRRPMNSLARHNCFIFSFNLLFFCNAPWHLWDDDETSIHQFKYFCRIMLFLPFKNAVKLTWDLSTDPRSAGQSFRPLFEYNKPARVGVTCSKPVYKKIKIACIWSILIFSIEIALKPT